ncbi:hypothetical protein CDAR_307761 [Caerostris darwini]|uniref:Ribosomal protein L2 n=1 Tax=Caerostris darwini TaxID=1538125 RepID=A0AAV4WG88_9ARAC|nr:hypothetical protein CDAR_307761 [Caerostris darwini]
MVFHAKSPGGSGRPKRGHHSSGEVIFHIWKSFASPDKPPGSFGVFGRDAATSSAANCGDPGGARYLKPPFRTLRGNNRIPGKRSWWGGRPERGHHSSGEVIFHIWKSFASPDKPPGGVGIFGRDAATSAPLIAGIRYLMNARFPGGVPQEKGSVVCRLGRLD